jgi:hypothetical protein
MEAVRSSETLISTYTMSYPFHAEHIKRAFLLKTSSFTNVMLLISYLSKSVKYKIGVASNGITLLLNFVKTGQLILKLKGGTDTKADDLIRLVYFLKKITKAKKGKKKKA